jgi:hypothetical protein
LALNGGQVGGSGGGAGAASGASRALARRAEAVENKPAVDSNSIMHVIALGEKEIHSSSRRQEATQEKQSEQE